MEAHRDRRRSPPCRTRCSGSHAQADNRCEVMAVTTADIKARFPEFAAVDDTYLGLVLADAETELGDAWGTKRDRAVMLLTAHFLTLEGSGVGGQPGAITSE